MNALDDLIQAAKDMDFHGANYYSNASIEARERAEKACRELFPPMAKALVWDVDGVAWLYSVTKVWKINPGSKFVAEFMEEKIGLFDSEAEAKAACEAHHQARFLEQLA